MIGKNKLQPRCFARYAGSFACTVTQYGVR
ncbi:hypothetical protein DFP87_10280 [Achromobacter marplatensis]|jgi:hypothetical protein|uniref:Uncharacterized protein n=1 Tax=Achromobacter marplatensis TaxID=470868 RepID=A0ABX9GH11_9BURK|nr:hypothetical protein DFP87_10280 [Achromobacter marplatensis]CAB3657642.1 hypothetical protein LMG26219_03119 [Achromobacter marplatensis]